MLLADCAAHARAICGILLSRLAAELRDYISGPALADGPLLHSPRVCHRRHTSMMLIVTIVRARAFSVDEQVGLRLPDGFRELGH